MVAIDDVFAPWVSPTLFDDARAESLPGFDVEWRAQMVDAWRSSANVHLVDGGTYVQSRGPRFETPAEVRFYAGVGDVVGMTLAAEMVLAREAGIHHAAVCVVDNLANGVGDRQLTVSEFEATARTNRERLWAAVFAMVAHIGLSVG
jgi:5'-methylthioadenosine phosphorylase